MSLCDFQKVAMCETAPFWALNTQGDLVVVVYPWTGDFGYLGTDRLLDVNAPAARKFLESRHNII